MKQKDSSTTIVLVFITALAIVTFLPKAQAETSEEMFWRLNREYVIRQQHQRPPATGQGTPIWSPRGLEGWAIQNPDGSVYIQPFDGGDLVIDPAFGGFHVN